MKKLLMALALMPMMALADEEWVNGYCWSYAISNGNAEIVPGSHGVKGSVSASAGKSGADVGASSSASTGQTAYPSTSGNVICIPSVLGGCPVTRIGDSAFASCTWMVNVKVPSSVTSIADFAFEYCSELISVDIPSSVQSMGGGVFLGCGKLATIYTEAGDSARVREMISGASVAASTIVEETNPGMTKIDQDKVMDDWHSSSSVRSNPTWVAVGDDEVEVDQASYPYVFPSSGAVLNRTQGGYRLDLNGVLISSDEESIQANGDIAIYLEGENFIESKRRDCICLNSMSGASHRLMIFGPGRLTVFPNPSDYGIFACDDISIMAGSTVSVYGGEKGIKSNYGNVLISGSMVGVYGSSYRAIECNNLRVLAAMLSVQTTQKGIYATGDFVADAAIVNAFASQQCVACRGFYASHSYLALAATALDGSVLQSFGDVAFDGCVAKVFGFAPSVVQGPLRCIDVGITGDNGDTGIVFGEGDYYIGLRAEQFIGNKDDNSYSCGVYAGTVVMNGGNVQVCSPGVSGVQTGLMDVEGGILEVKNEFNTAEMFKFDAGIAAAYTAAIGAGIFDASTASVDFYTQIFLDALSNGLMKNINGQASSAVNFHAGNYVQNGGTVLAADSIHGILTSKYAAIVNGGSCHATFQLSEVVKGGRTYYETRPVSVGGGAENQNLKCVEYTVSGASKYDKVSRSWSGVLPTYYGTGSLYADESGKLYFWVPESWDCGSGSDEGSGTAMISFDAQGGMVDEVVRTVLKCGNVGTLPTPTRTGYEFLGWFTAVVGGTQATAATVVTADATYYARWSANSYVVTFNVNGGNGIMANKSMTYDEEKTLTACAFTKTGYAFAGWATDANGAVAYADGAAVKNLATSGTVTFYAKWTPIRYSITYANTMGAANPNPTVYTIESALTFAPLADIAGWKFIGWSFSAIARGTTGNLTVSANWEKVNPPIVPDDDEPMDAGIANTYDGMIVDADGLPLGYITVKAAKASGKGDARTCKVTSTIQMVGEAKKVTVKGRVDVSEAVLTQSAPDGRVLDLLFTHDYVSGTFDGYQVEGVRNLLASTAKGDKGSEAKARAEAVFSRIKGNYALAYGDEYGYNGLSIAIMAKGKVKVSGKLANGTSVSTTSQLIVGEVYSCIPVIYTKKSTVLALNIYFSNDGTESTVFGYYDAVIAPVGGLSGACVFDMDGALYEFFDEAGYELVEDFLPWEVPVVQNGTKWIIADGAKAGQIKLVEGEVIDKKESENPSGLKLTFTAKTGIFKGSFKVYALDAKGKLKNFSAIVAGVVVDGVGYGTATIKKIGSVAVMIE